MGPPLTCSENSRTDPDMGCAMHYGGFKITTHAHAQVFEIIALGNFGQKIEMFFRCLIDRWNAHKPRNGKSMGDAAFRNESVSAGNTNTRLLFFITRIDLNKEFNLPRPASSSLKQPSGQFAVLSSVWMHQTDAQHQRPCWFATDQSNEA